MRAIHLAVLATALVASGCIVVPISEVATSGGESSVVVSASSAGTAMGAALNAARAESGLAPLVPSAPLMAAAEVQARHMAATGTVGHRGPGGSTVAQRVRQQGCAPTWTGENVAMGQLTDADTMARWMASPGHRRNVLQTRPTAYGSAVVGSYRALVLAAGC